MRTHRARERAREHDLTREKLRCLTRCVPHHNSLIPRSICIHSLLNLRALLDDVDHNADGVVVPEFPIHVQRDFANVDVRGGGEFSRNGDEPVPAEHLNCRACLRVIPQTRIEDRVAYLVTHLVGV